MEKFASVLGLISALVGLVIYFKGKADNAKTDSILGETRGRDSELKKQQDGLEKQIHDIDESIKHPKSDKSSKNERASKWDK